MNIDSEIIFVLLLFVEPLVVGLEREFVPETDDLEEEKTSLNEASSGQRVGETAAKRRERSLRYQPYLCGLDSIGAKSESKAFVCAGAAQKGRADASNTGASKPSFCLQIRDESRDDWL